MLDFAVSTIFKARDYVSAAFGKMSGEATRFGRRADSAFGRASRSASHFRGIARGVLTALIIRRGVAELQQGITGAARSFLEFDDALFSAAAKAKGFNYQTADGIALFNKFREAAVATGAATRFTATDSAKALDKLTLAGFNAAQAIAVLPPSADLATVAQTELAEAVSMSADMLGAFGLKVKDNLQLQKNMIRLNDELATVVTSTNTSMMEMYEAVTKGGPDFVRAGQKISTFLTFVGMLAEGGKKGEEAGVALRNMALRLADPSAEARKTLQALGIQVASNGRDFDDFIDIVARFRKATMHLGSRQQAAVFANIFQVRAATASAILFAKSREELLAFRQEIENSTGRMKTMADTMRQGLGEQWLLMVSALDAIGKKILVHFETPMRKALKSLIVWLNNVNTAHLIAGIEKAATAIKELWIASKKIAIALAPAFRLLGSSIIFIANHIDKIVIGMKLFIGLLIAEKVYNFTYAVLAAGEALAALVFTPVGAIITGIALLAAAAWWVYENWDKVSKWFKTFFSYIYSHPLIRAAAGVFAPWISAASLIIEKWKPVAEFFEKLFSITLGDVVDWFKNFRIPFMDLGASNPYAPTGVAAPNAAEVAARNVQFSGQLNIAGAPPGSTVSSKTSGAPAIRMELIGENP